MRIGFYQYSPQFGQVQANLEHIASVLERVEADLVVLPELGNSGYLFTTRKEVRAVAESIPGPTTEFLHRVARRQSCYLALGMPERAGGRFYNSAVLVGPEGLIGTYRKVHLFYEEKHFFEAGDLGFPLFEVDGVKLGVLVCFDHMFPEAARTLALQGAQIICHPSNLVLPEYGQLTTRVRSIENRVFWVLANRCGVEERKGRKLIYTGCSQIIAPSGTILAGAPAQETSLCVVEIDPSLARNKQVTQLNDLFDDRRLEFYSLGAREG
jgi:predicted amidohydrolase